MKNRKKKLVVAVMALSMMLTFASCASASKDMAMTESMSTSGMLKNEASADIFYDGGVYEEVYEEEYYEEPSMEAGKVTESGASQKDVESQAALQERKLIKTEDMNVETKEFPCQYELAYEATHIAECMEQGLLTSPVATEEITIGGITALEQVIRSWDA